MKLNESKRVAQEELTNLTVMSLVHYQLKLFSFLSFLESYANLAAFFPSFLSSKRLYT